MEKIWIPKDNRDQELIGTLSAEANIPVPVATLLVQRGIKSQKEADNFFNPVLSGLYDPFLMLNMHQAVERLSSAVERKERILIYGDYDVDGTTSVALLYSFLNRFHANIDYYIPDRYSEGYGVSIKGIDYAANTSCKLLITLDCGIKAVEKVKYAREKGIDVIICDHHLPGDIIPDAVAVLDPKQSNCPYPFKELSGCGVGFKLIHAYSIIHSIPFEEIIPWLDLVVVSIASDIVPIIDENRILAYFGLKQLNEAPRIGLKEIIREAEVSRTLLIEDIVFKIGPRINAAGRMESGKRAVDLLLSEDQRLAAEISKEINICNTERRSIDRSITTSAMRMISDAEGSKDSSLSTTVLFNPEWHKGVIGIVASRLIETYYRPTVILTESNGMATGSARSVPGYDLYQAIESCSDLLENFGGHMFAAGLTMRRENIPAFIDRFEAFVSSTITEEQKIPRVVVDAELLFEEIDDSLYYSINKFQPFGPENMAPVFMSTGVYDKGSGRMVGNSGEHLKLDLFQGDNMMFTLSAIAFGQANHYEYIKSGKPFDICYSLEMNEFRGRKNLQLNIKDIRPSTGF